jgi:hypothetical protein
LVLVLPAAWKSVELARSVPHDTQLVAEEVVANIGGITAWPTFGPITQRRPAEYRPLIEATIVRGAMKFYDFTVMLEPVAQNFWKPIVSAVSHKT